MARTESAVFTNMCMVTDGRGNVLVQDRKNPDWPGCTFPGGHVEPGESFVESVIREVREETGLRVENPVLCGTKQFQDMKGNRYVVFMYRADKFSGELCSSDEGEVFWVKRSELEKLSLADDFETMLRIFEDPALSEVQYYRTEEGLQKKVL